MNSCGNLVENLYNETHTLSRCNNVLLEAKRVILNEELDQIANLALSDLSLPKKMICSKKEKLINWDTDIWEEIPNPINMENKQKLSQNVVTGLDMDFIKNINNKIETLTGIQKQSSSMHTKKLETNRNNTLKKKYFTLWKDIIKLKEQKAKLLENKIVQKEKLDNFVKQLKHKQKEIAQNNTANTQRSSKSEGTLKQSSKPVGNYQHRFTAQKNIIEMQKSKLEEQNKLIEELKLGIIREDLLKSIDNSKNNIREIFANCSERLRLKAPLIIAVEEREKFMITTQKAPKVVQKMEQRAIERATNREIILERKCLMEETRQRLLEEAIEKKKALEEDERKRYLEEIKERRKKELEKEKARQILKQIYLEKESKAINFHNHTLLQRYFRNMREHFWKQRDNYENAVNFYHTKILKATFYSWGNYVEQKYAVKYEIADAHFSYKILKQCIKIWKELRIEAIRSRQVAEDVYDFRLTSNTFIHWNRYVCKVLNFQDKKMKIAALHHKRRLLFQCFYQWKSLPAVVQLEKAKEEKKRKWRERVWEILPDFKPLKDL